MKSRRSFTLGGIVLIAGIALVAGLGYWWLIARSDVSEIKASANPEPGAWPAVTASANDWPWWRGPSMNGEAAGTAPPINWSASKNIKWKSEVPGRGHASPILWGDHVFLLSADEAAQKIILCAYQRSNGHPRWQKTIHQGGLPIKHAKNSFASSTPACDGKHVYSVIATNAVVLVTACTLEGQIAWQTEAGPFISENGFGSSPLLWGPYFIVAADSSPLSLRRISNSPSFLAALDRRTGKIAWRVRRALGHSYGTPIIANLAGREQLLLGGPEAVVSYNPVNGEEYWRYPWSASRTTNTIAALGDRLVVTTTLPTRQTICLRGDGSGTLDPSSLLWKSERYVCEVPSPMIRKERVFLLEDNGIASCLSSQDGHLLWKGRLGSGESISASPVVHGIAIYASAESGKTYVFEDGPAFKLLATNDLGEEQMATPALAGGEIYIRTAHHLWCISEQKADGKP